MNSDAGVLDIKNLMLARARARRRKRIPVDALAHEELFVLTTTLRAANAASLYEMFFKRKKVAHRTAMRRLHELVDAHYLGHLRLDGARWIYHLTPKSLDLTPRLRLRAHASLAVAPPDRQAMYCWLRSSLWAALMTEGWTLGRSGRELQAVRRFLLDGLNERLKRAPQDRVTIAETSRELRAADGLRVPFIATCSPCSWTGTNMRCPNCRTPAKTRLLDARVVCRACSTPAGTLASRCSKCGSETREDDVVPYDIAWKRTGAHYDVVILLVDDPSLSVKAQLDALPFFSSLQPRLWMILRSTDPHSIFDRREMKLLSVGRRRAELVAAFADGGDAAPHAKVLDYRPDLQAYFAR